MAGDARVLRDLAEEVEHALPPVVYGSFAGGDPRKFDFDRECNRPDEAMAYQRACREADALPDWFFTGLTGRFTRHWSGMGLGGNYLEKECALLARAACALRALAADLEGTDADL